MVDFCVAATPQAMLWLMRDLLMCSMLRDKMLCFAVKYLAVLLPDLTRKVKRCLSGNWMQYLIF